MNNFLELINIQKSFITEKKINVLRGLSRKFRLGKTYAIMGPSGSGKSTLLNLISLIDKPTSGTIKFDNVEINFNQNEKNDLIRAKKIGIITISVTGKNSTTMTEMADLAIKVPSDQTNYIQEMHIAVGQLICGIVEEYFFKKN